MTFSPQKTPGNVKTGDATKKKSIINGKQNYTDDDIDELLDIVSNVHLIGHNEWVTIVESYKRNVEECPVA